MKERFSFMKKLLFGVLILVFAGLVFAVSYPPSPSAFYGYVSYMNGSAVPDGYVVTAEVDGVVSGSSVIVDGRYGYSSDTLIVLSYNEGGVVEFYVNGVKAGGSALFEKMSVAELNLSVEYVPEVFIGCGDNVCDLDECGSCLLDCEVGVVDVCIGDGVCNAEIGEDCANSEADCGECFIENVSDGDNNNSSDEDSSSGGDSSGGGGSSSGGSGGGGSSKGGDLISNLDSGDSVNLPSPSASKDGLGDNFSGNNIKNPQNEVGFFSGVTGAVAGAMSSARGAVAGIFVLVVIGGFVALKIRGKESLKDNKGKKKKKK